MMNSLIGLVRDQFDQQVDKASEQSQPETFCHVKHIALVLVAQVRDAIND